MTMHSLSVRKHDDHDIGYRIVGASGRQHYFRTTQHSSKALSHCMLVASKDDLHVDQQYPYCKYCFMIEELRNGMDGNNETKLS